MHELLKEITQISIYLKERAERVNEVALFKPLTRSSAFDEAAKPVKSRKWRYTSNITFMQKVNLKFQSFIFKHLPQLVPSERLTKEAKFKTVLAMLLAQEEVRDFFLSDFKRRQNFYVALIEAASASGFAFDIPKPAASDNPLSISRELTLLNDISLVDDPIELNLQMAVLNYQDRSEILFRILNKVERPPIISVIEVSSPEDLKEISITTQYAKYQITKYEEETGTIAYNFSENHATSSIRTLKNSLPNAQGTKNQRMAFESGSSKPISAYCGEISTPFHVLEQILLILGQKNGTCAFVKEAPQGIIEKNIFFTSLYSWHEIELITDQKQAINKWDQKILKCDDNYYKLNLFYYNIPFNALNKFPTPAEIKASMKDINDETLIPLLAAVWKQLKLENGELEQIAGRASSLKELSDRLFMEKENALLEGVDAFRLLKPTLLKELQTVEQSDLVLATRTLLSGVKEDGKALKGMDTLLCLNFITHSLGYFHNKNCQNATDRSAGADAADKAQFSFQKLTHKAFLPGNESEEEIALFQVLYSMYLVWEEPEINTWLSTGFRGEKFYNNFFQKNPETTRYLVTWLKENPEMYLGLSDYRT